MSIALCVRLPYFTLLWVYPVYILVNVALLLLPLMSGRGRWSLVLSLAYPPELPLSSERLGEHERSGR